MVGNWLALCRTDPAAADLSRPSNLADAYSITNLSREISSESAKAMTAAARKSAHSSTARIHHNPAFRLASFPHDLLPAGGKLIIKRQGQGKRRNTVSTLQLPHPTAENFVLRYKAGRQGAFHACACIKRGPTSHSLPPNPPETFPWHPIQPDQIASLHPAARAFISLLSTSVSTSK
jgi:hypothetical protein